MLSVMRFWLERGVDGFRIDAAAHLFEEEPFLHMDEPAADSGDAPPEDSELYESLEHSKTLHQAETFELLHQWREAVDELAEELGRDHM